MEAVRRCSVCQNLTETEVCRVCSDPKRDASLLSVVESPADRRLEEQGIADHRTGASGGGGAPVVVDGVAVAVAGVVAVAAVVVVCGRLHKWVIVVPLLCDSNHPVIKIV